jgi:hypothetical protein
VGLNLNGTHQLLAYANHMNRLAENIETRTKNTETLNATSIEVCLEVYVERSKYMLVCLITRMQFKIGI